MTKNTLQTNKLYTSKELTLEECKGRFECWKDKKACALAVYLDIRDKFVFKCPTALKSIYNYSKDKYIVFTVSEYIKIFGDCKVCDIKLNNTGYIIIKLDHKGGFYG